MKFSKRTYLRETSEFCNDFASQSGTIEKLYRTAYLEGASSLPDPATHRAHQREYTPDGIAVSVKSYSGYGEESFTTVQVTVNGAYINADGSTSKQMAEQSWMFDTRDKKVDFPAEILQALQSDEFPEARELLT